MVDVAQTFQWLLLLYHLATLKIGGEYMAWFRKEKMIQFLITARGL